LLLDSKARLGHRTKTIDNFSDSGIIGCISNSIVRLIPIIQKAMLGSLLGGWEGGDALSD
jgi:hypothetical protein